MKTKVFDQVLVSTCDLKNNTRDWMQINSPVMLELNMKVTSDVIICYFHSDWGDEFSPREHKLTNSFLLDAKHGRSAKHANPNFYLKYDNKIALFHIAWSGNYRAQFTSGEKLNVKVSLEPGFVTHLNIGEEFSGFDVIYTVDQPSLNIASQQLHTYVRNELYKTENYKPPVVWNHWWSYEDIEITEDIFKANVDVAATLGFEYAMLDAGWFGQTSQFWELIRGDWSLHNKERFPSGIKNLANYVKSKGLKFGIWIELEGLGINSAIYQNNPQLVARRNGNSLEYVCLGSRDNQNWAFAQFKMLIEQFGAEYIKLDFNLDPGRGCNCLDHNHGADDGLYHHYKGLYDVVRRVKQKYPNVILENCSSGGLRADLALLVNMDVCFMSDPDYTEHSHQCYQGFRLFLPPERIFHFSWSHAIDKGRYAIPQCDFNNLNLSDAFKRYTLRSVAQHGFGISHPLIEYKDEDHQLIKAEIELHNSLIDIINNSKLYTNEVQTIKNFQGERNPYYVYETREQILVYTYGLEMAEYSQRINFKQLGLSYLSLEVDEVIDANYELNGDELTVRNKQQTATIVLLKKML